MDWKPFEKETTEDLIQYIKWKDDPEYIETSEAAFCAFTFRFRADLIKKCEIICNNWNCGSKAPALTVNKTINEYLPLNRWRYDPADLANLTFKKFREKPLYDHSKRRSARTVDEGVMLYLYAMANHELADIFREATNPNPYTGDETIICDFPEFPGNFSTERRKELEERKQIVDMALNSLGPKHKIIYLTYHAHGIKGKNLPAHLLKNLRDTLNLAQNTIRFYNFEANKTVDNYLKIWAKKNS